jgi:hypothetical protein
VLLLCPAAALILLLLLLLLLLGVPTAVSGSCVRPNLRGNGRHQPLIQVLLLYYQ